MSEVQILDKTLEVALKSNVDDVFMITPRAIKLERGRYGGWLLRHSYLQEAPDFAYGVWCYNIEEKEADEEVVEKTKDTQERVMKIANSLGVKEKPRVAIIIKRFRVVRLVKKRETDRYCVYDIEPVKREATAMLAYIYYYMWWSRRGKCHGSLCGVLEKFSKLLKAEFKDGVAVSDVGVYVLYDVSPLVELLSKLDTKEEKEEEKEATAAEAKEGGEARGGDDWDTYFIVVKLPPGSEKVITELEEMVRQKLKELNIAAAVWSVKTYV